MAGYDFSIQFSNVSFVPYTFPRPLFLSPSFSVTCNSREDGNGVDPPQLSPARRKERRGRERRRRREAVRWIEGGRKGSGTEGVRRRNGIHFEIASHPVRSPFSTAQPTPSRGLFPAPSLRKSHSPCSTRTVRLALYLPEARSLSGDSVLASNTDIEQSPFSLKPSSHQE